MGYSRTEIQNALNQIADILDTNEINYGETPESIRLRSAIMLLDGFMFNQKA